MFLHELPRDDEVGTKIYCEASDGSEYVLFHHVDGMYSYCKTEKGATVHLSVMTSLEPFEDGYKIAEEPAEEEVTPVEEPEEEEESDDEDEDDETPLSGGESPSFGGFGGGESGGGGSSGSW